MNARIGMIIKFILILNYPFVLLGCSFVEEYIYNSPYSSFGKSYHISTNEYFNSKTEGLVLGSISLPIPHSGRMYRFNITTEQGNYIGYVDINTGQQEYGRHMPEKSVESNNANGMRYGRIFVLRLPPGNYYVTSYRVNIGLISNISPPWRFTVTNGDVTYIGNMHLELDFEQNPGPTDWKWGPDAVGAKAMIYDDYNRDVVIFEQYFRKLTDIEIIRFLLEPSDKEIK